MDKPRIRLSTAQRDAAAMVKLAEILEPFDRDQQLRILEAACIMLREDRFAGLFGAARAAEKQASRDADAAALASGEVTREQLCRDNNMFSGAASIVLGKPRRPY